MRQLDFKDHRPPVSAQQLAAADAALAELGMRIPPSYRGFLAEHDGGPSVQDIFDYTERDGSQEQDRVHVFLGIARAPGGDLVETAQALHGRVIAGMLPIARDPFGNFLVLDTRDDQDGPIWLWDHEFETDEPDESNLSFVAPDLATLLEGLTPAPPPPPSAKEPERTGWRRLFGR